jgi:(5-formylfuran-3-yl)methyl phosphate synthase
MRLLVSFASEADVPAALMGGADIIDAKNPGSGALGPVSNAVLREIHVACAGARPVTAALGDAKDEAAIEHAARDFCAAGTALVKIGFAGIASAARVESLLAAAVRGAKRSEGGKANTPSQRGISALCESGVVAVAYAEPEHAACLAHAALVVAAARAGAAGVLLDTADKSGPGLRHLLDGATLAAWVAGAHEMGLFVALAGKLTLDDLSFAHEVGADIAGVRGAACEAGRSGRVVIEKVRALRARCDVIDREVEVRLKADATYASVRHGTENR